MNLTLNEIATAFMVLFAVIDILGSIPIILDIKRKAGKISSLRASFVSLLIMLGFLFLGERLIGFIGIDVNSFAVAGSIIIFIMALEMVLNVNLFKDDGSTAKTASIVPLAFPIIAGAGSMTTILSLRAEFEAVNIAVAIFLNIVVVFVILKLTGKIERLLGAGGIAVLRKVFGIVLLAIAIKLFSSNIKVLFN
ncbi:MarC family protein [Flavobacteriales bacterium]|jgi:multiple antibiotic resistance protein|nr:MarC family protein [Flavobacteriales bacterium]MDB2361935.1 MarC family protein [Flavobacteriales bacterium]